MSEDGIEVEDRRGKFAMIEEWVFDRVTDDGAYRLYGLLAMSVHGGGYKLSRQWLAERCGCSVDTVDRRLKLLRSVGVLEVQRTSFNGGFGWSKYVLLGPPRGGRKSAARVAANLRPGWPQECGLHEHQQVKTKKRTPQPPSGGKTARCSCGEVGVVGVDVFRHVEPTAPYGKRTQYLHPGCKPRVQYGVQEKISTSDNPKDWM